MTYDLAILNVVMVDPRGRRAGHIYVKDGAVAAVTREQHAAQQVVDGSGLTAIPGAIDGHVHFMDPAETEREDFIYGSSAAAAGGVTTVIEHSHHGAVTTAAQLKEKVAYLANRSVVDFGLAAHVMPGRQEEMSGLWATGATFFKFFTCTTHGMPGFSNADTYQTLEMVSRLNALSMVHCEDEEITAMTERELRTAGVEGGEVLPLWRIRQAEQVAVNTVALIAEIHKARVVIAHTSHPEAVRLAAERRRRGAHLYIETCPQYLYLNEMDVHDLGPLRKFTPPARARSTADLEAMWDLVGQGVIHHIFSDHAPANEEQKRQGIWDAPFGLPGVETTLPLLLKGVSAGRLSLERVVELVSEAPARMFGLFPRKGTLTVGADADIVLVDMSARKLLTNEMIVSKAGWTPYAGMELHGLPVMTFSRGRLVAREGKPVGAAGWGRFQPGPGAR